MTTRPIDLEDICEWPDGTYCTMEDLESFLQSHSDDYIVHAWDSPEARRVTGEQSIVVEEFDTEIIYDESGIQVGETSTRLPILKLTEHVWHTCDDINCQVCVGGLSLCIVCNQAETDLTPSCPGA